VAATFPQDTSWKYFPLYEKAEPLSSFLGSFLQRIYTHSKKYKYPGEAFDLYKKRTKIEERHRQLKGFWDLTKFSSPAFSLVNTQILFKLATYSLMQLYLVRSDMAELAKKTISTIKKKEKAGGCVVILYSGTNYEVFDLDEYSFILMKLKTDAKKRLTKRIKTWNKSPLSCAY